MDFNSRVVPALDAEDTMSVPTYSGNYKRFERTTPNSMEYTRLQLIDEEQAFSDELPGYMKKKWSLWDAGFDYDLVAVFGSQSTGKSTLLNRLFGTKFDVMNEDQRKQTTRGIWADRGSEHMPVLILDVEGTDGRERGENQDFERKSALFSLAVSEVLIVNMWENMVGLYNGANMGLLKTVLEVNLQLFGSNRENKTLLYFVIRDHVSPTPLESLSSTLQADIDRIWDSLSKPKELQDSRLTDYFDLRFTSLPHKLLQPENFERAALELRKQFTDKLSPSYVFKPSYKRRVPADGFPHYAKAIWEKVVNNKDLDLPTQQELLAQYRCDEIAASATIPFRAALEPLRPRVQDGEIVPELAEITRKARSEAVHTFDTQAARYHANVYKKKRASFIQQLDGELHAIYLNQVKNALALAGTQFTALSHKALDKAADDSVDGGLDYNFIDIVAPIRKKIKIQFTKTVEALLIPGAAWSFSSEMRQLDAQLEAATAKLRVAEMERTLALLRRNAKDYFSDIAAEALNNPDENLWKKVMDGYEDANRKAEAMLVERLESTQITTDEDESRKGAMRKLHSGLWDDLIASLREEVGDQMVLLKLRTFLEDKFRYDANGLPRVWKPTDDMDAQFAEARESAQKNLPLFSKVDIQGSMVANRSADFFAPRYDFERTLVLISSSRQRELTKRFAREADALFLEAKRSMVTTQNHVPIWVFVLLVVLGWNEAMTILFNPIYLILTAIIGGASVVIHNLGLWGPVFRTANALTSVANDRVHDILVEAVNRTEPSSSRQKPEQKRRNGVKRSKPAELKKSATASGMCPEDIELEPLGDDAAVFEGNGISNEL